MKYEDRILKLFKNEYLTTKDVNDNEIKVFGATGLSMNLDHDGDTTAVIRAKKNGESYINYLTNEANLIIF